MRLINALLRNRNDCVLLSSGVNTTIRKSSFYLWIGDVALVARLWLSVGWSAIVFHQDGGWSTLAIGRVPVLFCSVIYCCASLCINLERLLRYTDAPHLRASDGIVFLFIVRIVPQYHSSGIALYLPKRFVEPKWFLQLYSYYYFLFCSKGLTNKSDYRSNLPRYSNYFNSFLIRNKLEWFIKCNNSDLTR